VLVSVIVPTFNRSDLLVEAIRSIIAQTYRPIECVVVDDGSTDNTAEVLKSFQNRPDNQFTFKYILQKNAGAQVARNTGTAAASGEFIQYLDSDDLLYPEKIAWQVEYFNRHPECDAVFGDWELGTVENKEKVTAYKSDDLLAQMLTERCIANFAVLMQVSLVKKIGDWDVNIKRNQEIDFHLRGILAGGKFEYHEGLCGLWRMHEGKRISSTTSLQDAQVFFDKWVEILKDYSLLKDEISVKLSNMYLWLFNEYNDADEDLLLELLQKVIALNPSVDFYNKPRMILLRILLGKNIALKVWIKKYRY
jgi:glycosyltransferase involved in cell wall biosynthesis